MLCNKNFVVVTEMNVSHKEQLLACCAAWFNHAPTSDVNVVLASGPVVYCHRIVLSAWSQLWANKLTGDRRLFLTSFNASIAFQCLKYLYTGELELAERSLPDIHAFAQQNQLVHLQSHCEQVMSDQLSTSNCMMLFDYFLHNEVPVLPHALENAKALACTHFTEACQSEAFTCISVEALCAVLQDERLTAPEDTILAACVRWIESQEQILFVNQVLPFVRFAQLSPKALLEIKKWPFITHYDNFSARYLQALEWIATRNACPKDQRHLQASLREEYAHNDFTKRNTVDRAPQS